MNYTKGKWKTHGVHIIAEGQHLPVGLVLATWPNADANRNLQAAAPDMYEALKECVSWFREEIITKYMADGTIPYFEGYKTGVFALAKAEGKQGGEA